MGEERQFTLTSHVQMDIRMLISLVPATCESIHMCHDVCYVFELCVMST